MKIKTRILFFLFSLLFSCTYRGSNSFDFSKRSPLIIDMVHHNPGEALYDTKFNSPKYLREMGYNGIVFMDYLQAAVPFSEEGEWVFPEGSEAKEWIQKKARSIKEQNDKAKSEGLKVFYFTDFVILPQTIYERYKDQVCDEEDIYDISKPKTLELVSQMLDEMFKTFPEVDGLVIRIGEVYDLNVPYHKGMPSKMKNEQDYVSWINFLREEICVKHNKLMIYRNWGFDKFCYDKDYYLNVVNRIEPHPNLIFSIKHNRFNRMNPFLQMHGEGKHPQVMEFQCAREFEGKGAHPNYVAKGLIEGFEEYANTMKADEKKSLGDVIGSPNFAGLWTWSRGGGWSGPYIQNELWCELNAYVAVNHVKNPKRTERELIDEYARKIGLVGEDVGRFREICYLSADGVLRGREKYQGETDISWNGRSRLWIRDCYIGGEDQAKELINYIVDKGDVQLALDEKAQATALWKEIVDLAMEITSGDKSQLEFIQVSCIYGRIKYELLQQCWTIFLLGAEGNKSGNYEAGRLKHAISRYDQLWKEWKKLKEDHPLCPTLYKDHYFRYEYIDPANKKAGWGWTVPGIKETVDKYRERVKKIKNNNLNNKHL